MSKKSSARYQAEAEAEKSRADAKAADAAAKAADASARAEEAKAKGEEAKARAEAEKTKAEAEKAKVELEKNKSDAEAKKRADEAARQLSPTAITALNVAGIAGGAYLGHKKAEKIAAQHVESLKAKQVETANLGNVAKKALAGKGGAGKAQELAAIAKTAKKMGIGKVKGPLGGPLIIAGLAEGAVLRYVAPNLVDDPATKEVLRAAGNVPAFAATSLIAERMIANATLKFLPDAKHVAAINTAKEVSSTKARKSAQAGHKKAPVPNANRAVVALKGKKAETPATPTPTPAKAPKVARIRTPKKKGGGMGFLSEVKPKGVGKVGAVAALTAGALAAVTSYDASASEARAEGANSSEAAKTAAQAAVKDAAVSIGGGLAFGGIAGLLAKIGLKKVIPGVGAALMASDAVEGFKKYGLRGAAFGADEAAMPMMPTEKAAAMNPMVDQIRGGLGLNKWGVDAKYARAEAAYKGMQAAKATSAGPRSTWGDTARAASLAVRVAKAALKVS
jgi:hypothetical protein